MRAQSPMHRLLQNKPQCHLTSCLMCLSCFGVNITPKQAAILIGHDCSQPRGVHPDELLDFLRFFRLGFITFDAMPVLNDKPVFTNQVAERRFMSLIKSNVGMLVSDTHVVAWDGEKVFDPNPSDTRIDDLLIRQFQQLVYL